MGYQPIGCAFSLHLLWRLAEGESFGLRKNIRQKHIVMPAHRIHRFGKGDEVTWDEPGALMNELVERVLPVGSRLAPVDRSSLTRNRVALNRDMLSIALHG